MNDQAMRFRVGLFVLGALTLLVVLITLFGGVPALFKSQIDYTILFRDAPGVGQGTPVRRLGVRVGEVRDITLEDDMVRIKIVTDPRHPIRKHDQVTLTRGLLGGDTTIDFLPADDRPAEQNPPLERGAVIEGAKPADFKDLVPAIQNTMQTFERLSPQVEATLREYRELAKVSRDVIPELRRTNDEFFVATRAWSRLGERLDVFVQTNQGKLEKVIDNLNDTMLRFSSVLSEENQKNFNQTLRNVRSGTESLESISKNTDELIKESRQTIKRVNDSVKQADDVLGNLQKATKPMAERSDSVMRNLDESTLKMNRFVDEAREVMKAFQGDSTIRSLMTDPTLYNNLNDAACMLTRIMPRVDRVLKDMELFADKIARHPEALGLGGVVTPGSGLKK